MDAPLPGGLGGTYGGNALACAAALAVLDAFEQDGLLERANVLGRRLRDGLLDLQQKNPAIGDVRGLGFMQAIEIVTRPEILTLRWRRISSTPRVSGASC